MHSAVPHPARPGRRAFTLVELLVVILILATVMGIMLPVIPRVRDSARRTACAANLRSVGQAIHMHKDKNQDRFPVARYMPPPWLSADPDPALNAALAGEMEHDSPAWRCPGDMIVHAVEYEDDEGALRTGGVSYTYIAGLSGRRYEETLYGRFLGIPTSQAPVAHDFDGGTFETQDGREFVVDFFHSKRSILYADSHVK